MHKFFFRHNLLLFVLFLMLLPLPLALISNLFGPHVIFKWMAADYRLGGMTNESSPPPLNFAQIRSHEIQHHLEKQITNHLPLRSFFIHLNNQIYYSFFQKSYLDDGRMVIGKSKQLYEIEYINSYCGRVSRDAKALTAWADKIKRISNLFEEQGKVFIYLITPSKAESLPEQIPERFHCNKKMMSQHVEVMENLLRERHINYINGSKLMKEARKQYGLDMFPRGGIHWNTLGAAVVANAIIKVINNHGCKIKPIEFDFQITKDPQGQDRDLVWLLNLLHPDDSYPVPLLTYKNNQQKNPMKLTMIGGSFLERIIDVFMANKTFSHISDYPYFRLGKVEYEPEKKPMKLETNLAATNFIDPILASDIIILEENSALTLSGHGQLFYSTLIEHNKREVS